MTTSPKPSIRDLHLAHVAALTADHLEAAPDDIVDGPKGPDYASVSGHYDPWKVSYPKPDDLDPIIYQADDTTVPTIGNDG